jgi:hypothetical protein
MAWFIAAISAYLIFAIVWLIDKHLLTGPIPSPKVYAFYVGMLGVFSFLLIPLPFVDFSFPSPSQLALSLFTGALLVYALFWFYKSLHSFEASRAIPTIWGLAPIFTFGIIALSSFKFLSLTEAAALLLLAGGTTLISIKNFKDISLKIMPSCAFAAFLLALFLVLTKYVYLEQSFWSGFIWIRAGGVVTALGFLFFVGEVKEEIFKKREILVLPDLKIAFLFISNQSLGGIGAIAQNLAIFWAPLAYVSIINALQGIQYIFLLFFAVLLSLKFPWILKEEISQKIIFQKIIAILLIGAGLALFSL